MAESNSNKVDQVAQPKPSMQEKENPTNLLQRFSPEKATQEPKSTDSEKKAEVNLGLSLGSLYSPNSTEKLLTRSSSVAGVMTLNKEAAGGSKTTPPRAASLPSLERSSSLPAETGQRVLSVKDLQAMRRMEVKKRLAAKGAKAAQPPPEVAAWTVASAPNDGNGACRAVVKFKAEGYITYLSGPGGVAARGSTTHFEPLPEERDIKPVVTSAGMANGKHANPAENELENPSKKVKVSNGNAANGNASNGNASNGNAANGNASNGNASNGNVSDDNDSDNIWENGMEAIAKMPCVRTTGNGPNGRRIEGFLYQYLKGNVRIVCVCHGSFLSPAEFVKHAGGGEVENPMRHITVCTNPFPL